MKITPKNKVSGRRFNGSKTPDRKRSIYRTPDWLYNWLNLNYGPFDIDVAACEKSAKCEKYYTKEMDGLKQPWNGRIFCNPPYDKITPWINKGIQESDAAFSPELDGYLPINADLICFVIPQDLTTEWALLAMRNADEVIHLTGYHTHDGDYIGGRVSFLDADTMEPVKGNNKGTSIYIFRAGLPNDHYTAYNNRGIMEDELNA